MSRRYEGDYNRRERGGQGRDYDYGDYNEGPARSGRDGYDRGWGEDEYGYRGRLDAGGPGGYAGGHGGWRQNRGYANEGGFMEGRYDYPGGGGERPWYDRAADEMASWFGNEDAERRRRADELRERGYRGRGPRGYQRTDSRIEEDVNDRLTDDYYLDASDIEVSVSDREVTLTGVVGTRAAKRRAEDIAESISGVTNVENRLRVRKDAAAGFGDRPAADTTTGREGAGSSRASSASVG